MFTFTVVTFNGAPSFITTIFAICQHIHSNVHLPFMTKNHCIFTSIKDISVAYLGFFLHGPISLNFVAVPFTM